MGAVASAVPQQLNSLSLQSPVFQLCIRSINGHKFVAFGCDHKIGKRKANRLEAGPPFYPHVIWCPDGNSWDHKLVVDKPAFKGDIIGVLLAIEPDPGAGGR